MQQSDMIVAFIGKTEEQLTDEDLPYELGVALDREIAHGQIRGRPGGVDRGGRTGQAAAFVTLGRNDRVRPVESGHRIVIADPAIQLY